MTDTLDLHRLTSCDRLAHVELHDVLPSTSDLALRRAADAALETPALVVATEQSAGRGRGQNRWWSSRGALTFSLVIEPARLMLDEQSWPRFSLALPRSPTRSMYRYNTARSRAQSWPPTRAIR